MNETVFISTSNSNKIQLLFVTCRYEQPEVNDRADFIGVKHGKILLKLSQFWILLSIMHWPLSAFAISNMDSLKMLKCSNTTKANMLTKWTNLQTSNINGQWTIIQTRNPYHRIHSMDFSISHGISKMFIVYNAFEWI